MELSKSQAAQVADASFSPASSPANLAPELMGGEILVKALQAEGVQYLWGYPGGAVLYIYDALYKQDSIQHVLVRHEQAAVHAADGFARATGEVGVALVTSGPGLTNAVTGIATAYTDSIPLVVISGQTATAAIGTDAFQECDTVGITRPVVKHNFLVKDVRELAAACQQLVEDTTGTIDEDVVLSYHGGKVEATGFRVADAAMAGNTAEALRLLRHALAVGVDPLPIIGVLASQVRQLIKVGSAGRGHSGALAKELGMAPWQVDKARRQLQGWNAESLGRSLQAVAAADYEVKGGGRDRVYAVERAVLTICREHAAG